MERLHRQLLILRRQLLRFRRDLEWSTYFSGSSFSRIAKYLPQFIEYLL